MKIDLYVNICLKIENFEVIVVVGVVLLILFLLLFFCCLICFILVRRKKWKDNEKEDIELISGSRYVVELLYL